MSRGLSQRWIGNLLTERQEIAELIRGYWGVMGHFSL